jgi:plasmid stabilization system protein ParE
MNFTLLINEEARQDILQASAWYEDKRRHLGKQFADEVIFYLKHLTEFPLSYQRKYKENRELLLKTFPYVIVYRVTNPQTVIVLAVAHCKQNSKKKRKRKI